MWMDDEPGQTDNLPPLSLSLGADGAAVSAIVGAVSGVVNGHKRAQTQETIFRIADLHIGDGHLAAGVVGAYRLHCGAQAGAVVVAGIDTSSEYLQQAQKNLEAINALGPLDLQDVSGSPANMLRNRLQCGGGADMVMYAHAAYPSKLPPFKLPRMVDRLGDMAAPHGAVVTLHNHGPADVDDIRRQVLGMTSHTTAGINCNTQQRLEDAFHKAQLYSFSVTVPNTIDLPANMRAVEAIFVGDMGNLSVADAQDAKAIRSVLQTLAGGEKPLRDAISAMDGGERVKAVQYFADRIQKAGGKDLPVTVGGGQMVMAFRSPVVAREAFSTVNSLCQQMTPPAIALPISRDVMPEFDKHSAHSVWRDRLTQHGISRAPRVCQVELDRSRT
jgi:hypothetical protein